VSPAVSPTGVPLWDDDDPTDRGVPMRRDLTRAEVERQAQIDACTRCDERGLRLPVRWWECDHRPEPTPEDATRGAARAREALAAARRAGGTTPAPLSPPAPRHPTEETAP